MPRNLQEKMKYLPEADFHHPSLSKFASSRETEHGYLKGMGMRLQLCDALGFVQSSSHFQWLLHPQEQ